MVGGKEAEREEGRVKEGGSIIADVHVPVSTPHEHFRHSLL